MTDSKKMEWALRVGVAGEFIGHGLLAIGKKPDWVDWMMRFTHLPHGTAATLLMLVGTWDLLVAMIILIKPISGILLWATFWGFWTALLRPIMGVGWLDFVERSANWAGPLALYYFYRLNKTSQPGA